VPVALHSLPHVTAVLVRIPSKSANACHSTNARMGGQLAGTSANSLALCHPPLPGSSRRLACGGSGFVLRRRPRPGDGKPARLASYGDDDLAAASVAPPLDAERSSASCATTDPSAGGLRKCPDEKGRRRQGHIGADSHCPRPRSLGRAPAPELNPIDGTVSPSQGSRSVACRSGLGYRAVSGAAWLSSKVRRRRR
jgi:hypothetical protein